MTTETREVYDPNVTPFGGAKGDCEISHAEQVMIQAGKKVSPYAGPGGGQVQIVRTEEVSNLPHKCVSMKKQL